MSFITLGPRGPVTAALDTTGYNPGNYTCDFPAAIIGSKVPYFEVYSMNVTLSGLATVTVYQNNQVRSTALLFGNSEWDPSQPILLQALDELSLAFDFGTGTPPVATIWLRYDPGINPAGGGP